MYEYPSNEEIKIGMKVLVELKKDRGTGNLTEGSVMSKLSTIPYDPNGILVELDDEQQGRVHKIIDPDFIDKNNSVDRISIIPGKYFNSRKEVIDLLSKSDDFMYFLFGYFRHSHFDILNEVLENNKNIQEIKIITLIQKKDQKNLCELLIHNAKAFKKQFQNISIEIKILNDKKIGGTLHNRYYFTKNEQWDFIDFDQMKNSQRSEIALLKLEPEEFKKNIERDFKQYWNLESALNIFNEIDEKKIMDYFDAEK